MKFFLNLSLVDSPYKWTLKTMNLFRPTQWALLALGLALYIWTFFPPEFCPDQQSMYAHSVVNLIFTDYFPPLSVLLWHALDRIIPGAELMLLVNFFFLWAACVLGARDFKGAKIENFFFFIPFVPSIFLDAGFILKDTILSFGFMFICMILANCSLKNKRLSLGKTIFLLGGVLYFSMAKVQAYYVFPFLIFWIVHLLPPLSYGSRIKKWLFKFGLWITLCLGLFAGMKACHFALVKDTDNKHYWQYVKIYDLAGMSVMSHSVYVPSFLFKTLPPSLESIETHYDYLWEPLIVYNHSPLRSTENSTERKELLKIWRSAIWRDPGSYLKHRFRIWIKILTTSALKGAYVQWASGSEPLLRFAPFFSLFSFAPLFPFLLSFMVIGFRKISTRKEGLPLLMMSSMGLMLIIVLFFCSLAAAGRYIYFSWCCFMFSVPFAYTLIMTPSSKTNPDSKTSIGEVK